ncbi:hypothetical protein ACFY6U_05065 [Streptomyces sp. NPDC013157]|uniref:hypothetical protein n=1 Tax=Streptomyces sp. NPDC013157 TaxID=3364861 RepID=UPI0036CDAD0B
MGVFARFLGKKQKASEEPRTSEEPEVTAPSGAEPGGPGPENAAEEAAEAGTGAKGSGEDDGRGADARTETERAAAAADTEIPQQQSAKEAADNEAGEGART